MARWASRSSLVVFFIFMVSSWLKNKALNSRSRSEHPGTVILHGCLNSGIHMLDLWGSINWRATERRRRVQHQHQVKLQVRLPHWGGWISTRRSTPTTSPSTTGNFFEISFIDLSYDSYVELKVFALKPFNLQLVFKLLIPPPFFPFNFLVDLNP